MDTSHQATTLTIQVGVDLLLECGLVQVSTSDTNTKSNGSLLCVTSDILEDGDGRVDTTTLAEKGSDGSARSLWCNEDNIDIGRNVNLGLVLEDWGETVREVESLSQ